MGHSRRGEGGWKKGRKEDETGASALHPRPRDPPEAAAGCQRQGAEEDEQDQLCLRAPQEGAPWAREQRAVQVRVVAAGPELHHASCRPSRLHAGMNNVSRILNNGSWIFYA